MIEVSRVNDDWLAHYRLGGEKAGKRHYQNPDGTYTELGKERRRAQYKQMRKDATAVGKEFAKRANDRSGLRNWAQANKSDVDQLQRDARNMNASEKVQNILKVAGTVATAGIIAAKIYDLANNGAGAFAEVAAKKRTAELLKDVGSLTVDGLLQEKASVRNKVTDELKSRNAALGALKTYQSLTGGK